MSTSQSKKYPPRGATLVLAPHPDDEVFGCGGAIMRHVRQGDEVKVIVITDGGLPLSEAHHRMDYVAIRQQESKEAQAILGYQHLEFLTFPDGQLQVNDALVEVLRKYLETFQPAIIYLPAYTEIHPDHLALYFGVKAALKNYQKSITLYLYEIGQPLRAQLFLDISDIQGDLERAMACFKSQLETQDYKSHLTALHRYRSYTLGKTVTYAEAYQIEKHEPENYIKKVDFQTLAHLQNGLSATLQNAFPDAHYPLISVIVRTMNRPELAEALDSIARQSYPNVEVVLVNAANDPALDVPTTCGIFPLRMVHPKPKLNRPDAANAGLDALCGDYFCFLDEDDLLFPHHLETLFLLLKNTPAPAAYCSVLMTKADGEVIKKYGEPFSAKKLAWNNYIPNMALLFKREVLDAGAYFDLNLDIFEDWDFLLQVATQGDFLYVDRVGAIYRQIGQSDVHFHPSSHYQYISTIFENKEKKLPASLINDWYLETIKHVFLLKNYAPSTMSDLQHTFNPSLPAEITDLKAKVAHLERLLSDWISYCRGRTSSFYRLASNIQKIPIIRKWNTHFHKWKLERKIKKHMETIKNSGFFEEDWYLEQNPDVNQSGMDALEHFTRYGGYEGRSPSPLFDCRAYLEHHLDVWFQNHHPLIHFLKRRT